MEGDAGSRRRDADAPGPAARRDKPPARRPAPEQPHVLALQTSAGNQAVVRLLAGTPQTAGDAAVPAVQRDGPAAAVQQAGTVDPLSQSITAEGARGLSDAELTRFTGALESAAQVPATSLTAEGVAHNLRVLWGERNRRRPDASKLPDGGETLRKTGVVGWQGDPELRLRTHPDTTDQTNIITTLPFNSRLQVLKKFPGQWYFVSTQSGDTGYAGADYIRTDAPEPLAQLHKVEPGIPGTAIAIAEHYYKGQADNWGQDLRFYVNVLALVNGQKVPNTTDGWRQVHFNAGQTIWVPSQPFARSLQGVVNSGSLSYNAADAVGLAQAIERVAELLEDFWKAIVDLSPKYMGEAIERHVEEMLREALKGLAVMLAVSAGVLAATTAIGGFFGSAPGAAAGFEVGMALLEWLGLGMLIVWVGQSVVQVGGAFASFFSKVWNARGDQAKLDLAARQFADAIGLLLAKLLEALIMYVSAKGLPFALKSVRGTKLGTAIGETRTGEWLAARSQNVAAGTSRLKSPAAVFGAPRVGEVPGTPAEVTVVGNGAAFHTLPVERLPANLPAGHVWARNASNEWVILRQPGTPATPFEIAVYSDGAGTNYVIRNNGRTIASDSLTRQGSTYSGDRLPADLAGTGADNPYRDPATGQVWDKSHGTDYADTLEGPGVRNSSTDPLNYTPGAGWWNRGPRNALVQQIRRGGGGYRELPLYDATPRTTANGTPIPREYIFVETNRAGVPQRAWRIPNDLALTDRSLGALNGRDIPLAQVPQAVLRSNAPMVPDAPGITYLPGVIVGQRGDDEER